MLRILALVFTAIFFVPVGSALAQAPLDVSLGDVSLNKVAFLVAEDNTSTNSSHRKLPNGLEEAA